MKLYKLSSILIVLVLLFVAVSPAGAQLGTSDTAQFTVQNIEDPSTGDTATVTIIFVSETGEQITPPMLTSTLANPFTLAPGRSQQVLVSAVPNLPSGRYSVIVGSTAKVAAMVGVAGDGPAHFNGSYTGFTNGADKIYLASAHYNGSGGWYAMVTVQNLGDAATNVRLTINCSTGATGSLTYNNLPSMASHTFVLKNTPMTFTPATSSCTGSAVVESTSTTKQPLAVVNNQNVPTAGNTNTIEGYPGGSRVVFVPNLQTNNSGWNSALNIRKIGAGNTTVTVDYDDAEPNDTCNLTDARPSCQLYMPAVHPTRGRFGAKITSSNLDIITSVGGSNARNSGAYVGVAPENGTVSVAVPLAMKRYYGYVSAINCQNMSSVSTKLDFTFAGYPVVHNQVTLTEGKSVQVLTTGFAFLPDRWYGGVTVQAVNSSARIACTVGNTNITPDRVGDWNNQYNAFQR